MNTIITNLVFKGGGVKGIAYAGAIQELEKANILPNIQRVAGTSAGAITAALVSLRYTAAEITQIVNNMNFTDFEDGWDPFRVPLKYGLYSGDAFLAWMEQRIADKNLAANATFADFNKAGMLDLYVFSTDLNTQNVKQFSFDQTPTVIVAEAIRASMSIPLFFKAWQFPSGNPDNHIYVDGGTIFNYPLTVFDTDGEPNPATLGFDLTNLSGNHEPNDLSYNHIAKYVKYLFETLLNAQEIDFDMSTEEIDRTVFVDDFGITATDFDISAAQKAALIQSGVDYTKAYLEKHGDIQSS